MKVIHVKEATTLAEVLSEAVREPVIVERNGDTFEVHAVATGADPFAHYDAEAAIAALDRLAAQFHIVDAEQWKAEIRAARGQAGREFDQDALPS